jgi:AmiR/NasT family two-component response regulator
MGQIKTILMQRDGMTEQEADELIADAQTDMNERLANGEMPDDICEEWFGLEPDYIFELL